MRMARSTKCHHGADNTNRSLITFPIGKGVIRRHHSMFPHEPHAASMSRVAKPLSKGAAKPRGLGAPAGAQSLRSQLWVFLAPQSGPKKSPASQGGASGAGER